MANLENEFDSLEIAALRGAFVTRNEFVSMRGKLGVSASGVRGTGKTNALSGQMAAESKERLRRAIFESVVPERENGAPKSPQARKRRGIKSEFDKFSNIMMQRFMRKSLGFSVMSPFISLTSIATSLAGLGLRKTIQAEMARLSARQATQGLDEFNMPAGFMPQVGVWGGLAIEAWRASMKASWAAVSSWWEGQGLSQSFREMELVRKREVKSVTNDYVQVKVETMRRLFLNDIRGETGGYGIGRWKRLGINGG